MRPFQLSDPAATELTHPIQWYEQQRAGLGAELLDAITETIELIRTHPEIGVSRRRSAWLKIPSAAIGCKPMSGSASTSTGLGFDVATIPYADFPKIIACFVRLMALGTACEGDSLRG